MPKAAMLQNKAWGYFLDTWHDLVRQTILIFNNFCTYLSHKEYACFTWQVGVHTYRSYKYLARFMSDWMVTYICSYNCMGMYIILFRPVHYLSVLVYWFILVHHMRWDTDTSGAQNWKIGIQAMPWFSFKVIFRWYICYILGLHQCPQLYNKVVMN